MVASISSTDSNNIKQTIAEMYLKMKAADTDGVKGLSRQELASIDTGGTAAGSAFLHALQEQFDKLDADKNGQISENDMKITVLNQLSSQGATSINSNIGNSNNLGGMLGSFSKSLAKNLLSNYKGNDLTGLASSFMNR